MKEIIKTAIFVILAAVLIAVAMRSHSPISDFQPEEMVGKALFPQFTDPLGIKSLEIVRFDAAGERNDFRVVEVNGIWSIPSHDNYPADAKDQMGKVAEALTDLNVLEIIQPDESGIDSTAFQTLYGVVDPTSDGASLAEGIGTKITLGGANNETFVNLIIGKEAALTAKSQDRDMMGDSDSGKTSLRYARIAGQSPVYVVKIDPSQFSTNFDQWIEKNLLDISTLDIKEFFLDEYSFSVEFVLTNAGIKQDTKYSFIGDITLSYDGSAIRAEKWSLVRWMVFEGRNLEYKERQIEADKELDTEMLDSMVSALNDLKIVSVLKKPARLASVLREGKTFENIELDAALQESMQETGFYSVEVGDLKGGTQKTNVRLLSNEGDLQLRLKNGIVYNLRFGDLTGSESEITPNESSDGSSVAAPIMGVNRYLFITAEFEPAMIPPPELKPVPEIPGEGEAEVLESLRQQKETIEKANQREQERYNSAIESGKKRAAELSERFADWYYVIAEDIYKKIHLTQANIFREKKLDGNTPEDSDAPFGDMNLPFDLPALPAGNNLPETSVPEPLVIESDAKSDTVDTEE